MGMSFDDFSEEIMGFDLADEPGFNWQDWKEAGWRDRDKAIAKEWYDRGWSPYSAKKWCDAGWVEPTVARAWRRYWFLVDPTEALKWYKAGWEDPFHAKFWFEHGWNDPQEAYRWYKAGWYLAAGEALKAFEKGLSPREALSEYEDIAWFVNATKLVKPVKANWKNKSKSWEWYKSGKVVKGGKSMDNIKNAARLVREAARILASSLRRTAPDDKRPPKKWWERCIERAKSFADDPESFCGGLWYHPEDFPGGEAMKESFGKPLEKKSTNRRSTVGMLRCSRGRTADKSLGMIAFLSYLLDDPEGYVEEFIKLNPHISFRKQDLLKLLAEQFVFDMNEATDGEYNLTLDWDTGRIYGNIKGFERAIEDGEIIVGDIALEEWKREIERRYHDVEFPN